MKFEDSEFSKLKHFKLEMPFGNFYFLESFFISEINEGVHFDWDMIKSVMDYVVDFYGADAKLVYIPNRINSYSINPQTWNTAQEDYNIIVAGAVVAYNNMTFLNASLEKKISKISIKRCFSLREAIEWALTLKELN